MTTKCQFGLEHDGFLYRCTLEKGHKVSHETRVFWDADKQDTWEERWYGKN